MLGSPSHDTESRHTRDRGGSGPLIASRRCLPMALVLGLMATLVFATDTHDPPEVTYENFAYDGRFTFNRVKFTPTRWGPGRYEWGLDLKWNHDYPRGESNFTKILDAMTSLRPLLGGGNITALDEPDLFKYPWTYVCEVGYWTLSEAEAEGLRNYLLKGGFLIVDDFGDYDWYSFVEEFAKVLPDLHPLEIEPSHPIFDSFFEIEPGRFDQRRLFRQFRGAPRFVGIFEDNDPAKRLMVLLNYNQDIGEFWEFSDTEYIPIDLSNEAYKLGVNYVIYSMTH